MTNRWQRDECESLQVYHRYEGFTTKYPFFPNGDVRDFHIKTRKLIFKIHYDVAPLSTGSVPMSD